MILAVRSSGIKRRAVWPKPYLRPDSLAHQRAEKPSCMYGSTSSSLVCLVYLNILFHSLQRSALTTDFFALCSGNNTGFKNFNPACPRRRCWYQHSRPYAGALIYAPWSNDNNISSSPNSGTTFQCPLPIYRPNQQHQQQQTSRAVASQTCGRYRHLLRAISSPDLSPSGSQTQRRLQRPPYYHSRHC